MLVVSCQHDLRHERYFQNTSSDTITLINPDFDTTFLSLPGTSILFYDYKVLDTEQESEDCKWLGDSLYIVNQNDSVCTKSPKIDANWTFTVTGPEKERVQTCVFKVDDGDFN
jgi:hypothetical protein